MAEAFVYFDKRRIKVKELCPIRIRVKHRSNFYLYTGVEALEKDWDGYNIKPTDKLAKTKNARLLKKLSDTNNTLLALEVEGTLKNYTDIQLKAILDDEKLGKVTPFVDYILEYCDTLNKLRTKEIYIQTKHKIDIFDHKVPLNGITVQWLDKFNNFLKSQKLAVNTISIHLRNIRSVINYCIDQEYTDKYPFRKYKIKNEATAKRSLSLEDLRLFLTFEMDEFQERYRDMFMLSFYLQGINMIDMLSLKNTDVINGRVEFRRAKTYRLYSIKITKEAQAIIDRYKGNYHLINIMDSFKDHKSFVKMINKHLKRIGPYSIAGQGGKKIIEPLFPSLTTYWARHTWATLAAELDIPKETIAHALGHGNNTVTDVYIDFNLKKVDEANRRVINYVLELDKTV